MIQPKTRNSTSDPTIDPTRDPTRDPTADPTSDPTTDSTRYPTKSPVYNECEYAHVMGVAFIDDNSCDLNDEQCGQRQEGISELVSALKNDNSPRLIYLRTEGTDLTEVVGLNDPDYNGDKATAIIVISNNLYGIDTKQ